MEWLPAMDLPEVIGPKDAAELLGDSEDTAYRMCRDGTMPGLLPRIGRKHRISRSQLVAWVRQERNGGDDGEAA